MMGQDQKMGHELVCSGSQHDWYVFPTLTPWMTIYMYSDLVPTWPKYCSHVFLKAY